MIDERLVYPGVIVRCHNREQADEIIDFVNSRGGMGRYQYEYFPIYIRVCGIFDGDWDWMYSAIEGYYERAEYQNYTILDYSDLLDDSADIDVDLSSMWEVE